MDHTLRRNNKVDGVPVSVIVLTFNEAANIQDCLQSVLWADDLIVVDSGSNDDTLRLARECRGDVRTFCNKFEDFGQQRNWALDETSPRHSWILFLDADERINPECRDAIINTISEPDSRVGYFLTCTNHFLGRPIPRCTLYPSWQLRLLRAGAVRFKREGHGQREVTEGELGYINKPYDHFGFSQGIFHWIDRHNHYSSNEVALIQRLRNEPLKPLDMMSRRSVDRRRFAKRLAARLGFRPLLRFVYLYLFRLGLLEGKAGLVYCLLRAAHEIHISAKLLESKLATPPGADA